MFNPVGRVFWLILSLHILLTVESFAQRKEYQFTHRSTDIGLSNSSIICILEDRKGFIWIGSHIGINKYDGYNLITYKNRLGDSTSITANFIRDLLEDREGNLWIASIGGVSKYNRSADNFTQLKADKSKPQSLASNNVETICEDHNGVIWVGTDMGLHKLDKKTNTFTRYTHSEENDNSIISDVITDILEDKKGNLWIGTARGVDLFNRQTNTFTHFQPFPYDENNLTQSVVECLFVDKEGNLWVGSKRDGLSRLDLKTNTFVHYKHNPDDVKSLGHNSILSMNEDAEGRLWIGTENGGLDVYDKKENIFYHYKKEDNDPRGLKNNSIHAIYRDRQNNMWVGTFSAGIAFCDWNKKKFNNYLSNYCNPNSLSSNTVRRFAEDKNGKIWMATDGGGINLFDPETKKFTHFKENPKTKDNLGGNYILSVIIDKDGNLWASNYAKGLSFLDTKTFQFTLYQNEPGKPNSLSGNETFDVYEDSHGNIWAATYGAGLNRFDKKTKTFTRYVHNENDPHSLSSNRVLVVFEDSKGNLWIGTQNAGLNKLDLNTNQFIHYPHDDKDPFSLSNNLVSSIFEDSKGILWICSFEGLNRFDYKTETFTKIREKEGLPNCNPRTIEEDDDGNLWIGTTEGIIKYDPLRKKSRSYKALGPEGDEIQLSSSLKAKNGLMYFGGNSGAFVFHPDSIRDNPHIPPVFLKDLQIFNQRITVGENSPLKQNINEVKEIELSYKQSVFSFEFVALNFTSPEDNQYAYKMEGFDKDWNYVGNKRFATYTNLDPAKYTFRVKASNNDGIWNEKGVSVAIVIVPPFWQTWWFRVLATVLLLFAVVSMVWYRILQFQKNQTKLEKQVHERTQDLLLANETLKDQKEELTSQSRQLEALYYDMKDSIRAAQVIQEYTLPTQTFIEEHLPDSFFLNKPKDVVSGDFYYLNVFEDKLIIASVDCTGHGVSGAFMSINSYHLLNHAIHSCNKDLVSGEVLRRLHEEIVRELYRGHASTIMEGMDIALCIVDKKNLKLQFSGANNPLYIVRNNELIQVKGDKFPIGFSIDGIKREFKTCEMQLMPEDVLYIFSDGYVDQFGGKSGNEKYGYVRFRDLLVRIGNEPMKKQLALLEQNLVEWKKDTEQIDDIMIIGFKV